jgi:hypothetical protein
VQQRALGHRPAQGRVGEKGCGPFWASDGMNSKILFFCFLSSEANFDDSYSKYEFKISDNFCTNVLEFSESR